MLASWDYQEVRNPAEVVPGTLSGLAYEQKGNYYWNLTDSGPGTKEWQLYLYRLRIAPGKAAVVAVIPVTTPTGEPLTGAAGPGGHRPRPGRYPFGWWRSTDLPCSTWIGTGGFCRP